MTNREMLDKYKKLIIASMNMNVLDTDILVRIGEALEKYMWMNAELEADKKKGDE